MLRDKTLGQEILLKACNSFAFSPSPVCWSILVNSSYICNFLCQWGFFFFAHYGRGLLLNAPGQVTALLLFGSTHIQHALFKLVVRSFAVTVPFIKLAVFVMFSLFPKTEAGLESQDGSFRFI